MVAISKKSYISSSSSEMWRIILFCSVLLMISAESKGIGMLTPIRRTHNISAIACIAELCEQYFHSEKQIMGAMLMVHIQNTTPFHDTLMKTLMERNHYAINIMNQNSHCRVHPGHCKSTEKAKNYLVAFRHLNEAIAALRLWSGLETWNPLAKFVAVSMNKYDEQTLHTKIRLIFETFFQAHALNVKVISFRGDADVIQMHTWYPYEGTNCANEVRNIHLVDECHYSDDHLGAQPLRRLQPLQPLVPLHLHGCPFRTVCSLYEPFVYDGKCPMRMGIEVHMVRSITRALGMKPIFIYINETRDNRVISNESGLYSKLLKRYDLLISDRHTQQL